MSCALVSDEMMSRDVSAGVKKLSHMTNFLLLMGEHINGTNMCTTIGNLKLGGVQLYNMTWYVMLTIVDIKTNRSVNESSEPEIIKMLQKNGKQVTKETIEQYAKTNQRTFRPYSLTQHHLSAHLTPPRFPALSFPVGVCTISHFGSGSLIVTGGSNENIVLYSIVKYLSLIEDLKDDQGKQRYKITSIRLSPINYVQSLILPFRIKLDQLKGWTYNPRKYPAAINNKIIPGASVTIFDSGAVNICGKVLIDIEDNIIDTLTKLCTDNNADRKSVV